MANENNFTCGSNKKRKNKDVKNPKSKMTKTSGQKSSYGSQEKRELSDIIQKKFSKEADSDSSSDEEDIRTFTQKMQGGNDPSSDSESETERAAISQAKSKTKNVENIQHAPESDSSEGESLEDEQEGEDNSDDMAIDGNGINDDDDDDEDIDGGDEDDEDSDGGDNDVDSNHEDDVVEDKSEDRKGDKMAAIRDELMSLPFDELQKLKDKLGSKVFQQAVFGKKTSMSEQKKRVFKRANKNRPVEFSSKVPVSRYREVVVTKKKVHRDPRFDDLSGDFKEQLFNQSYGFLNDVKARDLQKLEKKLKKEKNPEKQEQIKYLINRMSQQEKVRKDKEKKVAIEKSVKKYENQQVKEGKTPYFLKKSDRRTLELADKFRELKKSGKVEQYLSKKRKKIASKDRKKLPTNF